VAVGVQGLMKQVAGVQNRGRCCRQWGLLSCREGGPAGDWRMHRQQMLHRKSCMQQDHEYSHQQHHDTAQPSTSAGYPLQVCCPAREQRSPYEPY
jgi:hypothetical protein